MHSHGNPKGGGPKKFAAGQPCKIVECNLERRGAWAEK